MHSIQSPVMLGESPAMQHVFRAIDRLSRSSTTVLINGESGTGKELVARALHCQSPRAHKPFIALNMAAIPRELLESELFGHERGAFTGADARRIGRFEQANGGTLFLDEIGDMPLEMQTRLLRVLAEGEFYPVGAQSSMRVDVRIIAATHQNLETLVAEGRFREDLFHRLNVIRLQLPPLRERRQDIPALLHHYLNKAAENLNEEVRILAPDAETYLCNLIWPGNIRQLENVCHWLTVMVPSCRIELHDLPPDLVPIHDGGKNSAWLNDLRQWATAQLRTGKEGVAKEAIEAAERVLIYTALHITSGQRQVAAKHLGYGRNTLRRKIKELELHL